MSIQDSIGVYDAAEFAENPEARCSIVLILDISGSMWGERLDAVNRALVKFREIIREDPVTALRADIAIIAFTGPAAVIQDFTNGMGFEPNYLHNNPSCLSDYGRNVCPKGLIPEDGCLRPDYGLHECPACPHTLRPMDPSWSGAGTPFSPAVELALDIIEARKQSYRDGGIAYYRSLAYFLTDGIGSAHSQTICRLAEMEKDRSVAFFSFCVAREGMESLAQMVPRGRRPVLLTNMEQLEGSIEWLSRSVAAVSQSQPGESIRLPQQDFLDF